ncbi:MAG: AsmA-like C-terminal region-containing protein [Nitrospinales bacterium]
MPVSGKKIVSYVLLGLFLTVGVLGFLAYRQLTDLDSLKDTLALKIGEITQSEVSIGGAELNFDQGIGVKLKNVSLGKSAGGVPEMRAREILVVIKILPLLVRQVVIEKLVMQGSFIKLTRGRDGKFSVPGMEGLLAQRQNGGGGPFSLIKVGVMPQWIVRDSEIEFLDYHNRAQPLRIPVRNIHLSLRKLFAEPRFEFSLRGEIPNPAGASLLDISAQLHNPSGGFDLAGFSADGKITVRKLFLPQFESYLPAVAALHPGDVSVSLESRFSAAVEGPLSFSGNLQYVRLPAGGSPEPKKSPALEGRVDYKIALQKDSLLVEDASFQFGKLHVQGNGKLTGFASKNPKVFLAIESGEFSLARIDDFPLFSLLSPARRKRVRSTLKGGTAELRSLKFDGSLDQLNPSSLRENMAPLSAALVFKKVKWNSPFLNLDRAAGTFRIASGNGSVEIKTARHSLFPLATLTGKIKNLMSRPVADVQVNGDLTLKQLREILKTTLTDKTFQQSLARLQDLSGKGKIRIGLQGPLDNMDHVAVDAGFEFAEAGLQMRDAADKEKFFPLSNVRGRVGLERKPTEKPGAGYPWTIRFDDFSGDFGTNAFSGMGGEIRLGKGEPAFKVAGTFMLDAAKVRDLFPGALSSVPLWKKTDLQSGTIVVDYRGEGRSLDLGRAKSRIALELREVALKYANHPAAWSNLSGRVTLAENKAQFKNIRGRYGNSSFQLEGDLEIRPKSDMKFKAHLTSTALTPEDLQAIPFLEQLKGFGSIRLDSHWSGTPQAVDFRGAMDLTGASYRYGDLIAKKTGQANSIRLAGRIEKQRTVTIRDLVYEVGGNSIEAEGSVQLAPGSPFTFRIHAADLQTASLGLPLLENNQSGKANVDISGTGVLGKPHSTRFDGELDLRNLTFPVNGAPLTISIATRIRGKKLDIRKGRLAFADTALQFKGMYALGPDPVFDLTVSGKKLNLNRTWWQVSKSPLGGLRDRLEHSTLFAEGAGRLVFNLNHLDYRFWRLTDVRGEISLKNKTLRVNKLEIVCPNNNLIKGHGLLALADSGGLRFQGLVRAENIRTNDFLGQFGDIFVNTLSGKLKLLQADFQGEGGNWKEISHSLDGHLAFNLYAGRIDKKKLKRGVLNLLGLSKSKKAPANPKPPVRYERISGKFVVRQGIAETENFLYKTPKRVTSLVGKFDLARSKMDTVIGVAPLAALDKFLTQIPLLGKVLTAGDEKSLVKNYYTVRGKFNSPKITPVPFTSLGKKVIGIFQGIFQTPGDILGPLP